MTPASWRPPGGPAPSPEPPGGRDREALERDDADLPLRGIRVFDLTSFWAGPYASQILGFFGAEVLKVESIQRPDGTRMATSYGIRGDQVWERAPLFQAVNTGKRAVTLDLGDPRGQDLGRRLLAHCDVLVENYSPRVVERFGLLDEDRPDLITLRMPAWGLTGPWRDRPGFAQTMEQAAGLASVTGFPDGPPLIPRGPCDPIGALHGAFAVLAAIRDRDRTGLGQLVEVPLVETALNVAAEQFVEYGATGTLLGRHGNAHPQAAPHGVYRTKGEAWVAIAVMDDDQWTRLRDVVGITEWRHDPSLATSGRTGGGARTPRPRHDRSGAPPGRPTRWSRPCGRSAFRPPLSLPRTRWCRCPRPRVAASSRRSRTRSSARCGCPPSRPVSPHGPCRIIAAMRRCSDRTTGPFSGAGSDWATPSSPPSATTA